MNGTALAYELFSDSTMIFSVYSELNWPRPARPRGKANFSLLLPNVHDRGLNASCGWLGIRVPVMETRRLACINPIMALDCAVAARQHRQWIDLGVAPGPGAQHSEAEAGERGLVDAQHGAHHADVDVDPL